MTPRHAPRFSAIAALALTTTLLHGCGSGSGRDAAAGPGMETPGAEPAPAERSAATEAILPADGSTAGAEAAREGELLLASAPDGWKETGALQTPVLRMAEYGPADAPEGRVERLTFEAQSGDPLPDPIAFVLAVSRDLAARCKGLEDINISSGHENGYPTSVRLMICPKFDDSPHAQVVMAKAIQGEQRFYVVTRRLQVPPMQGESRPLSAQEMAIWTTHLKSVRVCDTRDDEHPCPQSVTEADTGP